ncbi:hypothetical protein GGX14DRAFT_444178 [Mycena pura]|uniref:HNH nuclease domain-containing protein n=1 Tax=Mycena pura TaxID=153505 RepID=A0AAD6VKY0_9AGAR|nr:hypothetical protein GGX14DRAFT_444178 [Mycena pura]
MALWTPSHAKECIVPLNSLLNHPNANTVQYLNEEQRNIHIWNSRPSKISQGGGASQFQLIANLPLGCWAETPNREVTTYELYRWLLSMCTPGGANPIQFLENTVNPQDYFSLLWLPRDPRNGGPFPLTDAHLTQFGLVPPGPQAMQPGHYVMAQTQRSNGQLLLRLHTFETHDFAITMRQISRGGTASVLNTEGNRKDAVIKDVRTRDKKCRATGQEAPYGSRGLNFSGLEVAHIYPLGSVENFLDAFGQRLHQRRLYTPLGLPAGLLRKKDIDIVQNAMVLRADVHSQFDEYQFGFVTYRKDSSLIKPEIRVFEKNGAPSISKDQVHYLQGIARSQTEDINVVLLIQHFLTGLLWHVAGNGLQAKRGAVFGQPLPGTTVIDGHAQR